MRRHFLYFGIVLYLFVASAGCDKDDDPSPPPLEKDAGEFIGTMNGKLWKPNKHRAVYYTKWQQLYIYANDNTEPFDARYYLAIGILLDFPAPVKEYLLKSNGDHAVEIETASRKYHSDQNVADAGGNFILTKFDTVQKLVSGQLQVITYSSTRTDKISFVSSSIKDIPLTFDTTDYPGNFATSTVTGVTTTQWQTKDVFAEQMCGSSSPPFQRLQIEIMSLLTERFLTLSIPISPPGVYQLVANDPRINGSCFNGSFRTSYNLNDQNNIYQPATGTLTIISVDPVLRKMQATFDITFRDTLRQETIHIKNGILQLEKWDPIQ